MKTSRPINPATEEVSGKIALGSAADVDKAVKAARKAFTTLVEDDVAKSVSPSCSAS